MRNKLAVLLAALTVGLWGCAASGPGAGLKMSDLDIVAKDKNFAVVRLRQGIDYADLAAVFYGERTEAWQITEVNAASRAKNGDLVAVPLRPVNSSSVYSNGYRTLPILCYHQFTHAPAAGHQLELTAQMFEEQIKYLISNGYALLSFADVQKILQAKRPIPKKAVVITIDDGYRSVYDVAWPILKKYRAQATLFIYTDFIGAPAALNWAQIKEMSDSGFIEIESHAKSHTSLSPTANDESESQYSARLQNEYAASKRAFKKHHGKAPRFLSYPYGDSSVLAAEIAKDAGIELAATVTRGDNTTFSDPYLLHRTMIYDSHSMSDFKKMLRNFRSRNLK